MGAAICARGCAAPLRTIAAGRHVRFETQFESFEQTADNVVARLCDLRSRKRIDIRSAYLIGADGARSAVRDAIGATMVGDGPFRAITASSSGRPISTPGKSTGRPSCIG